PFGSWEERIFGDGALVWGRAGYEKTGVEPYVHPDGARVPSLRRLWLKAPYFTNGSAATLEDVLAEARWSEAGFAHAATNAGTDGATDGVTSAAAADGERIDAEERRALLAFLRLL